MTLAHQSEVPEQSANRGIYSCFSKSDGFDHKIRFDHLIGIYIWHLQSDWWVPIAGAYFKMDCFVSFAQRKTVWNYLTQLFHSSSQSDCWGQWNFHNYCCPHPICSSCTLVCDIVPLSIVPDLRKQWTQLAIISLPTCTGSRDLHKIAHFAQYCERFCDKCGLGNVETMAIIASGPAPQQRTGAHKGPDIGDLLIRGLITCDPKIAPGYPP